MAGASLLPMSLLICRPISPLMGGVAARVGSRILLSIAGRWGWRSGMLLMTRMS